MKGDDPDATIEISPLFATTDKLLGRANLTQRQIATWLGRLLRRKGPVKR
jgi:hypothetical protein